MRRRQAASQSGGTIFLHYLYAVLRAANEIPEFRYRIDFDTFYREAKMIIEAIPEDGDPYAAENGEVADGDYGLILLSATPDLYFTSITGTQEKKSGNNYPLLNARKVVVREGKLVVPIAMTIHHGFIDGHHLSLFYKKVEDFLK